MSRIPFFDDHDLLDQWRDENRAGNGYAFSDPDDHACQNCIYTAAESEGAQVICRLNTPNCYLVMWDGQYHVVADCHGWWACRVSL